jgi:hypothetical protein
LFIGSIGLVFVIALAGFAAFFAACWVSCIAIEASGSLQGEVMDREWLMLLINVVSGGLALSLVVWLFRKTWPRRRAPPK